MIAVSLKDGEQLVDLLLRKEGDVNAKSKSSIPQVYKYTHPFSDFSNQVSISIKRAFPNDCLRENKTALHFTASKNNLDIARRLLENKPPASTRVKDKRGQYPIHRAAAVGSVPMVELLLKHKSPINATDVAGQTPLHHAIAEGHGKFLHCIISKPGTVACLNI